MSLNALVNGYLTEGVVAAGLNRRVQGVLHAVESATEIQSSMSHRLNFAYPAALAAEPSQMLVQRLSAWPGESFFHHQPFCKWVPVPLQPTAEVAMAGSLVFGQGGEHGYRAQEAKFKTQ